jgi:hypothetical protein
MPRAVRFKGILKGMTAAQISKLKPDELVKLRKYVDERDPVVQYKPGPTAQKFAESLAPWRLIFAANQVGKTTALIWDCCAILKNKHPYRKRHKPVRILLLVPSRAQACQVFGARMINKSELKGPAGDFPFLHDHEYTKIEWAYSPQGKYPGLINMIDGSTLCMALSGDKNSWKRLEGITFDYVYRDEADGNENLGDELNPRLLKAASLRDSHVDHWWLGGMAWGFTKTKVNDEATEFQSRCESKTPGHEAFYPDATVQAENPAVSLEQRMDMASRLSEDAFKLRGLGTATAESILSIFPEVDFDRHIVPNYDPTDADNIWFGWDPGITDRFGLVAFCLRPEYPQTIHILDWFSDRHKTLDYQAQVIARYMQGRKLEGIIADQSSRKREYSRGKPIIELFMEIICDQLKVGTERGHIIGISLIEQTVAQVKRYLDPIPDDHTCRPLIVCNDRARGFMEGVAKARLKNHKIKMGDGNIAGRNLEAFDLVRYIVSRQPIFVPRPINRRREEYLSQPSAFDRPEPPSAGPYDVTPGMHPDEVMHRRRLAYSHAMMDSMGLGADSNW